MCWCPVCLRSGLQPWTSSSSNRSRQTIGGRGNIPLLLQRRQLQHPTFECYQREFNVSDGHVSIEFYRAVCKIKPFQSSVALSRWLSNRIVSMGITYHSYTWGNCLKRYDMTLTPTRMVYKYLLVLPGNYLLFIMKSSLRAASRARVWLTWNRIAAWLCRNLIIFSVRSVFGIYEGHKWNWHFLLRLWPTWNWPRIGSPWQLRRCQETLDSRRKKDVQLHMRHSSSNGVGWQVDQKMSSWGQQLFLVQNLVWRNR